MIDRDYIQAGVRGAAMGFVGAVALVALLGGAAILAEEVHQRTGNVGFALAAMVTYFGVMCGAALGVANVIEKRRAAR